jgi:bifunctional non-homologous end joining protein LigD
MSKQRIDLQPFEVPMSTNNRSAANRRRCAVKKHRATRLHYDLRLEFGGVLLSWALPEGPSYRAGECRIAIRVQDHDPEYMTSERVIPHGERGAGTIMLWDEGTYVSRPGYEDIRECLRNGYLPFTFECHKLKGNWALRRYSEARPGGRREVWELIKEEDEFARGESEPDIVINAPNSVSTGRTLEEIEQDQQKSTAEHSSEDQLLLIFTFEP